MTPLQRRVFRARVPVIGANAHHEQYEEAHVLRLQDVRLPTHICLGLYEAATTEELHDIITDLNAELARRPG